MKILAAITDVVHVKRWYREFKITKIKRCLVYDPSKVTCRDYEKEKDDGMVLPNV
jgi:hypothetical protein